MDIDKELESLKIEKDNPVETKPESLPITENLGDDILARLKMSKKAKKKAKKKEKPSKLTKTLDKLVDFGDIGGSSDEDEPGLMDLAKSLKKSMKKKNNKFVLDSDNFLDDDGKKKKKDTRKKYEKMFLPEANLLKSLLKDADTDGQKIKKVFNDLTATKVRGVSKALTDTMATIVSANSNKLAIIKAMSDLKTKTCDLAMKEDAHKKGEDDAGAFDQAAMGAKFMQDLFGQGNREFTTALKDVNAVSEDEYNRVRQAAEAAAPVDPEVMQAAISPTEKPVETEIPDDENIVDTPPVPVEEFDGLLGNRMEELNDKLKDDAIYGRSDDGDNLIRFEQRGVKVWIRKFETDDGPDWEFVAIDRDGNEVPEYPLPDKRAVAPVHLNDETGIGTDSFGRQYSMIFA